MYLVAVILFGLGCGDGEGEEVALCESAGDERDAASRDDLLQRVHAGRVLYQPYLFYSE